MDVPARDDCPNCGAVLADDAWFCGRCGSPVAQGGEEPDPEGPPALADWHSKLRLWGLADWHSNLRRWGLADWHSNLRLWGPRVATVALVVVTGLAVLFAILALFFDVFVEP